MLGRFDVRCDLSARFVIREFVERPRAGHEDIDDVASEHPRDSLERSQGDALLRFGSLECADGRRRYAQARSDLAKGEPEPFADRLQPAMLRPTNVSDELLAVQRLGKLIKSYSFKTIAHSEVIITFQMSVCKAMTL